MKRLISVCLAAVLLLAGAIPVRADEAVREIYDVEGLRAMTNAPEGRYRLMNDIDMIGVDWTPIAFSGELDGGGHTLYNLTVTRPGEETRVTRDGNKKEYDTTLAGLFSALENASVHDLRLTGAHVAVENDTHCFAALLAGYIDQSDVSAVSVQGRVRMTSHGVMVGVGGLTGFGFGSFDRCDVKVELVFEDQNFDFRCEEFMGGVLACGIAEINACVVDIDGYDSCHGYVHNGGLVGMSYHCATQNTGKPVTNNIIEGRIRFFEDNPDRRAYCEATIGEPLTKPSKTHSNHSSFKSDEVKTYDVVLLPELCEEPSYEDTVVAGEGGRWGYTMHQCAGCGYHWTDTYTPPAS